MATLAHHVITEQRNPRCRAYATNRPAIREHLDLLLAIADKLDSRTPATARAIALTNSVLRDGAGPLYDPQRADELGPALRRILLEFQDGRDEVADGG